MKQYIIIENEGEIEVKGWDNNREFVPNEKVVEVPETFEELKDLCRATKYIQDILKKNSMGKMIPVYLNDCGAGYVIIKDLYFGEDGDIFYEVVGQRYIIAKDLKPAQMWNIIKNLIGE